MINVATITPIGGLNQPVIENQLLASHPHQGVNSATHEQKNIK